MFKNGVLTKRTSCPESAETCPEQDSKVDGLPVYNACVRIPGTYSQTAGAQTYAGQGPKVLLEGHIDTVNPPVLPPPKDKPYMPIKLQKADSPLVKTPQELAAIPDELHFDKNGKNH